MFVSAVRPEQPLGRDAPMAREEGRKRACVRAFNESAERANASMLDASGGTELFACECGDSSCWSGVYLTRAEYEDVRALASHFLIARNHENPETDVVIWENQRWAIVESVGRESVMAARRSDPRQL